MRKYRKRQPPMEWEDWYALAEAYRAGHPDLLISRDYVSPGGEKLGRWIERQRAKYNGVPSVCGHIEPWQIDALEKLGMVWKLEYRRDWERWLAVLDDYRAEHGHMDIPFDCEYEGYHLGNWLKKQRQYHAEGTLGERETADLEARGVHWNLRTRRRSWEDWYAEAEAYYRRYGNLRVKQDYLTPEGNRLGIWIYGQRDIYAGRKKSALLTPERVKKLNAIGMIWEPMAVGRGYRPGALPIKSK